MRLSGDLPAIWPANAAVLAPLAYSCAGAALYACVAHGRVCTRWVAPLRPAVQSGTVGIFSWGDFGDVSDRLLGHPESVDAMVALSDDIVVTGSSDGMVRVVGVHPNKARPRLTS